LPQRKEPEGSRGFEELKEILAVTSESQRLGERLKATTGNAEKRFCISQNSATNCNFFLDDVRDVRK